MDTIKSYSQLTLGKYQEIQSICQDDSLEEIDKQVQVISVLTGMDVDEVLHLPIGQYKELANAAAFLSTENIPIRQVAKKYIVGGFELIPVRDFRKLETCQYIDFQTYAPDLDNHLVEFLSVILVPKGHRYNEGYDILDVQAAIRDEMSVVDGFSLSAFFLIWCRASIVDSLNYCKRMVKGIKDKQVRMQMMTRIQEQEMRLMTNGDGLQM